MAVISTTVNRLSAVSDLFDSFHGAQSVCSALKDKNFSETSIFEFVQLTANDDLEARAAMLKDLGFTPDRIELLHEFLGAGKILICVDSLDDVGCARVQEIFDEEGALGLENHFSQARVPDKKKAHVRRKKAPTAKKAKASEAS